MSAQNHMTQIPLALDQLRVPMPAQTAHIHIWRLPNTTFIATHYYWIVVTLRQKAKKRLLSNGDLSLTILKAS